MDNLTTENLLKEVQYRLEKLELSALNNEFEASNEMIIDLRKLSRSSLVLTPKMSTNHNCPHCNGILTIDVCK